MKIGLIIPARKGSKTIKNKNLKLLNNVPLAEHTFKSVKSLNYPKFILSNDKKINKIANKYGIISDYKRPKKVSEDKSSLIETLENFVLWLKNSKYEIDVFVILQVTSPLRRKLDIVNAINFYKKNKFKSLFSVSESQEHPFETINLFKKTKWKYNIPLKKNFYRRQDYNIDSYFINGAIYIVDLKYFIRANKLISKNHGIFVMNKINSIDVDDEEDFEIANKLIK